MLLLHMQRQPDKNDVVVTLIDQKSNKLWNFPNKLDISDADV